MIDPEVLLHYMAMRKAGVMGRMWIGPENHGRAFLAPVDAPYLYEHRAAKSYSYLELAALIEHNWKTCVWQLELPFDSN